MSEFGDAAAVPPELNHTMMSSGDLGASLVSAAAGYESVADMLMAELTAMGLNTSTTAMVAWQGPGGVMMQMSAAEFMAVCAAVSAWVRIGQAQAAEVATAHSMAVESMIPAEVCTANLATTQALSDTNFFGVNTPAIVYLVHQYGEFWVQNATARSGYGAVVSAALAALAAPPPLSPTAANPAGPAAAAAQNAAMQGGQSALQASAKTMTQVADAPAKDAAAAPNSASSMVSQLGGQMGGLLGQVGSSFGQVTQLGQQLPQMLGQAPQMLQGMLGPLGSMQGLNATSAASVAPGALGGLGAPPVGGLSALAGGGGGGGGLVSGPSALSSSFVRPATSFSAPNAPTLPGGWQGGAEPGGAVQTKPAMGGGGMYGAPPSLGRDGQSESGEKSTRTMQVTARPGTHRGERQRI
jgi:PPE-repeat protein